MYEDELYGDAYNELWDGIESHTSLIHRQERIKREKFLKMSVILSHYSEVKMPIVQIEAQDRGEISAGDGYEVSRECGPEDVIRQAEDEIAEELGFVPDENGSKLPPNSATFMNKLRNRKTHLQKAGIGQLVDTDQPLALSDVFNRRKAGANMKFLAKLVKDPYVPTYISGFEGTDLQKVGFPVVGRSWRPGMVAGPVITPAPTCARKEMLKLLRGNHYKNFSRCLEQVDFQSQLPNGSCGKAFIALVDSRSSIATEGVLCAVWLDLGKNVCQAHFGPQVNFNMRGEEIDTLVDSLCLSTQFKDVDGYPPGTTILTYESMEFVECHQHIESSSRCKPTWDQIEEGNLLRGKRVMAGLNLLNVINRDDDSGEKPIVEEFSLFAAPQRIVDHGLKFSQKGEVYKPLSFRSKLDLRSSSVREFSLKNLNTSHEVGSSSSTNNTPRLNLTEMRMPDIGAILDEGNGPFNFVMTASVPKDCKLGKVVGSFSVIDKIHASAGKLREEIMSFGTFKISANFEVHSAKAPLSGLAFACVLDRFDTFSSINKAGVADVEMCNLYTISTFTLREEHSFSWDITQGVAAHCRETSCKIHIVCINANVEPLACNWYMNVFGRLKVEAAAGCIGDGVKYPNPAIKGKLTFGPLAFKKQEEWQNVKVNSNFASPLANASYVGYNDVRARFANYLAMKGNCVCDVEIVSSPLVYGLIALVSNYQGEIREWDDLIKVPSSLTTNKIPFRTKYGMVPTRGSDFASCIQLYPISGITGTKDIKDDFVCWLTVNVDDIDVQPVGNIQHESWFTLAGFTTDSCTLTIPNSVGDFTCTGATVAMSLSPLSLLVATHAMFVGQMKLHVSWCTNVKLADTTATINIAGKSSADGLDWFDVTSHCGVNSAITVPFTNQSGIKYAGTLGQMIPEITVVLDGATQLRNIHFTLDCTEAVFYGPKPYITSQVGTSS